MSFARDAKTNFLQVENSGNTIFGQKVLDSCSKPFDRNYMVVSCSFSCVLLNPPGISGIYAKVTHDVFCGTRMFVLLEAGRFIYGEILVDLIASVVYPDGNLRLKVGNLEIYCENSRLKQWTYCLVHFYLLTNLTKKWLFAQQTYKFSFKQKKLIKMLFSRPTNFFTTQYFLLKKLTIKSMLNSYSFLLLTVYGCFSNLLQTCAWSAYQIVATSALISV